MDTKLKYSALYEVDVYTTNTTENLYCRKKLNYITNIIQTIYN